MPAKTTTKDVFAKVNMEYTKGDIQRTEELLLNMSKTAGQNSVRREQVHDRLAALACEQGLFASAAYWYLQVLQSKIRRLSANNQETKEAIRNYRILLGMSQTDGNHRWEKRSA